MDRPPLCAIKQLSELERSFFSLSLTTGPVEGQIIKRDKLR